MAKPPCWPRCACCSSRIVGCVAPGVWCLVCSLGQLLTLWVHCPACVFPVVYTLLKDCLEVTDLNMSGVSQTIPVPQCISIVASERRVFIASHTQILAVVAAARDDWLPQGPATAAATSPEASPVPTPLRPSAAMLSPRSPGSTAYDTLVYLPGGDTVQCNVQATMTAEELLTQVIAKCEGKPLSSAGRDAYVLKVSGRLDNFHGDRYLWDGSQVIAEHECIQCVCRLPRNVPVAPPDDAPILSQVLSIRDSGSCPAQVCATQSRAGAEKECACQAAGALSADAAFSRSRDCADR